MAEEGNNRKDVDEARALDDLLYQAKMTRRMAISTAGKVGIAAGASAVIFGLGGYFAGTSQVPPPAKETMTTVTRDRTVTATQERVTTVTAEKVITVTATPAVKPEEAKALSLILAMATEFDFMDPRKTFTITPHYVVLLCYDRLLRYDLEGLRKDPPEFNLKPALATKIPEIEQDGKVLIFPMRKDVKFGRTGNPVNAEAVKFTIETAIKLKGPSAYTLDQIQEVSATDEFTAKVTLKSRWAPALNLFASWITSAIDPADAMAHQEGGDFGSKWLDQGNTAGSGPFVLEKFTREVEYVMVKNKNFNPAYRDLLGKIDRITFKHIPEPADQSFLVQRGDAHMAFGLNVEQFSALRGRTGLTLKTFPIWRFGYLAMDWNHFKQDARLLKAVKLALDYEGIVKGITGGLHRLHQSPLAAGALGFDPKFGYYFKRDVAKAKQLLADAGFKDGFETNIDFIAGFISGGVDQGKLAQKIQADLEEVGFKTKLRGQALTPWVEEMRTGKLQLWIGGISSPYADPDAHATYWPSIAKPRLHWENAELNNLTDEARSTTDLKKRAELYAKYQEMYLNIGPTINMYQIEWPVAMKDEVKDLVYSLSNIPMFVAT